HPAAEQGHPGLAVLHPDLRELFGPHLVEAVCGEFDPAVDIGVGVRAGLTGRALIALGGDRAAPAGQSAAGSAAGQVQTEEQADGDHDDPADPAHRHLRAPAAPAGAYPSRTDARLIPKRHRRSLHPARARSARANRRGGSLSPVDDTTRLRPRRGASVPGVPPRSRWSLLMGHNGRGRRVCARPKGEGGTPGVDPFKLLGRLAPRLPEGLAGRAPRFIREMLPRFWLAARLYFRAEVEGFENVPDEPVLFVGNHSGGANVPDTFVFILGYYSYFTVEGRPLAGLAHQLIMKLPVVGDFA